MDIKAISKEIYDVNVSKGFWEDKGHKNVGESLMLCVSELSEALEAHRKGLYCTLSADEKEEFSNDPMDADRFVSSVKNTFEDEIADTMIRLMDLSVGFGIDIEWHIRQKVNYNKSRPYKHGKAY